MQTAMLNSVSTSSRAVLGGSALKQQRAPRRGLMVSAIKKNGSSADDR